MKAGLQKCLIIVLLLTFVLLHIGSNQSVQAQDDFDREALIRLLEWRVEANFILQIDRSVDIDSQVQELWELVELSLSYPPISELPPEIGNLTNLQTLSLRDTQISELPPEIGNLINLTTLDLSGSPVSEILPEIESLPNLTIYGD